MPGDRTMPYWITILGVEIRYMDSVSQLFRGFPCRALSASELAASGAESLRKREWLFRLS